MKILAWILSLLVAFGLGASRNTAPESETDAELRNRVQQHLDTIVDEGAAILDDVNQSIQKDPRVQEAEKFVGDAKEVAEETLQDLDKVYNDTKDRVEEKFGAGEAAQPAEDAEADAPADTVAPEETPAAEEPAAPADPDAEVGPDEQPVNG